MILRGEPDEAINDDTQDNNVPVNNDVLQINTATFVSDESNLGSNCDTSSERGDPK